MLPDAATCIAARTARDEQLRGVFFVGAGATFCVSDCPSRIPARARMTIFASAPQAVAAGFKPCRRCAPLAAPRVPDWRIEETSVVRGLRLIERGYLRKHSVQALAQRLGVSTTALRASFVSELSVSPSAWAKACGQRVQSQIEASTSSDAELLSFVLPVREPYDQRWVFDFLDQRSLPGIEEVVGGTYRRRVDNHWLSVSYSTGELRVELPRALRAQSTQLLGRVAHVFDVHADLKTIDTALKKESWLAPRVTRGIRVPGAWDGFETAVRAILGQQVSVARARNLAIDLMQRFGSNGFPLPSELVDADVSAIGMPGKRGEAVRQLARATLSGALQLDNAADSECELPVTPMRFRVVTG